MKSKPRHLIIFSILLGYVLLQFLWWEVLLVKQTGQIIDLNQKIAALNISNQATLLDTVRILNQKKKSQVLMVVGEGTIFLLLLLFGIYKIKQSQDKEASLNNQQKNFFLSITHELKTPIAATKLQLQTLQKQKLPEETQQELLANALKETERLNILIDNVLLAGHLEADKFTLKLEKQNLSQLLLRTLNRYYKKEIELSEIKLKVDENICAKLDETSFPSIITNLIDNAIKYSPQQKEIMIELFSRKNKNILSISDKGIGIPDLEKEKVFTKFFRVGNEVTRSAKGTGLGLYIVNYLVKKHLAVITLKDNKPNGCVFEIEFNAI